MHTHSDGPFLAVEKLGGYTPRLSRRAMRNSFGIALLCSAGGAAANGGTQRKRELEAINVM
jgi:hypothetical protein